MKSIYLDQNLFEQSIDAEHTGRGHADRYWAIVLACQKERGPTRRAEAEVGVRVIG